MGLTPTWVRISGVFAVPVPMSSGAYQTPRRGYLYFRIRPGAERESRRDWSQLKSVAAIGQVVGFASYWVPNPSDPRGNPHHSLTVRMDGDTGPPDVYPIPFAQGIVRAGDKGDFDEAVAAELRKPSR